MLDSEQRSQTDSSNNNNEKNVVPPQDKEGEGDTTTSGAAAATAAEATAIKKEEGGTPSSLPSRPEKKGENGEPSAAVVAKEEAAAVKEDAKEGETTTTTTAAAITTTTENKANGVTDDANSTTTDSSNKGGTEAMDVDEKEAGVDAVKQEDEKKADVQSSVKEEDVEMKDAGDSASSEEVANDDNHNKEKNDKKITDNSDDDGDKNDKEKGESAVTDDDKGDETHEPAPQQQSTTPPPTAEEEKKPQQQSATTTTTEENEEEKKTDGEKTKTEAAVDNNNKDNITSHSATESAKAEDIASAKTNNNTAADAAPAAAPSPPPPILRGTLSYNLELRRHVIRGMWAYENSNALPPQRFELLRTLEKDEDPKEMPKDGEFHGSFSLAYYHTTSKGKQKERSKVITEHGVNITFVKVEGTDKVEYKCDGKGTNQFGIFHINGTATPCLLEGDVVASEYSIVLRKRYEPSPQTAAAPAESSGGPSKKRKADDGTGGGDEGPLPPPSKSYPNGVVCLRGKLEKEDAEDLGATDLVHRINGMWSSGLDLLLADPQNVNGHCNRFEYEHKSTVPSGVFPISGKYSGWFHLTTPEGKRTTITERDVVLRFTKNNAGYHNVEGRGLNAFGKYTITGTLSMDNVLTIFRHFKPIKIKTKAPAVTSAPPPINTGGQSVSRRPSQLSSFPEPRLTMEEVKVPGEEIGEPLPPIQPPVNTSYSAVSQGVLRLNEDGSHECNGKWAVTREHFTSGQTSPFKFRLEPHFALEASNEKKKKEGIKVEESTTAAGTSVNPHDFPLDSTLYKGSFQLKKKGTRYDTVVDQQIVMKFRMSSSGAYNVYGRGVNGIGVFNLVGTLIMQGKISGQVELYRMYPPELLVAKVPAPAPGVGKAPAFHASAASGDVAPLSDAAMPKTQLVPSTSTMFPGPPRAGLLRRESTRLVKLPSRLEDDDPQAQLIRIMEKCVVILRHIRERDIERGAFFSEAVDPIALGIPTYRLVIKEPMDLGEVNRRLEADHINTPEEFSRLVRLTFENAITFNVDPNHSVHLAARYLLVEFNKKFRDIDRLLESLRRAHKGVPVEELEDTGKKKTKDGKKRKRQDEPKSAKRRRLDEAQAMTAANTNAMAAIVAAAPQGVPNAAVSRGEFSMMVHMIQLLQKQIVQTHNALAELSPGDEAGILIAPAAAASSAPGFDLYASLTGPESAAAAAPGPERKRPKKKAAQPALKKIVEEPPPFVIYDNTMPLTLEEQETLTETINNMPPDHIPGVIQIIRESADLGGDEEEIDLEIDQLDTVTQRKLLRHVSKYIKQPKRAKGKAAKKPKAATKAAQKKAEKVAPKKPASPKKSDPGTFFAAFGDKDDSDSDSDDDDEPRKQTAATTPSGGKHFASAASSKSDGFDLGDGFSGLHDDNDDDLGNGGITANWNIASKAVTKDADKEKGGDDDDWGAAREEAAAVEARKADRKAREDKLKAEAEHAKNQRLADAAAQGEKLKAQRLEDEENEAKEKAEKEKKEKDKIAQARAEARAQTESVEQTVDLDAQRDIMKQYEQSFLDKELGSASPSSDFGF